MSLTSQKPWFKSNTVWGALAALATSLLLVFVPEVSQNELAQASAALGAVGNFAWTVYGRIRARDRLTK